MSPAEQPEAKSFVKSVKMGLPSGTKGFLITFSVVFFIWLGLLLVPHMIRRLKMQSFKLQLCPCHRSLPILEQGEPELGETTCSRDSWKRGSHQKVLSFAFYVNGPKSAVGPRKKYFDGVVNNLHLMQKLYSENWVMRLYTDMSPTDPLMEDLCSIACSDDRFDICPVSVLPMPALANATKMFPMNWRFFPTMDPQVDLFGSRDLDSLVTEREAAAVAEWESSSTGLHSMRDNPYHTVGVPIVGGCWGARLEGWREEWSKAWTKIFRDPLCWEPRSKKGPDQKVLKKHVWPWARFNAMQHDSYRCGMYPGSIGFPTRRKKELGNYIASNNSTMWFRCPKQCRRQPEWTHC